jgi:hypothetical protein
MVRGAEMHPREAVQHIVLALLDATDGDLEDDAAAMCLDWHGGPPRERTAESGANDRVGSERPSRERTTESGANE